MHAILSTPLFTVYCGVRGALFWPLNMPGRVNMKKNISYFGGQSD